MRFSSIFRSSTNPERARVHQSLYFSSICFSLLIVFTNHYVLAAIAALEQQMLLLVPMPSKVTLLTLFLRWHRLIWWSKLLLRNLKDQVLYSVFIIIKILKRVHILSFCFFVFFKKKRIGIIFYLRTTNLFICISNLRSFTCKVHVYPVNKTVQNNKTKDFYWKWCKYRNFACDTRDYARRLSRWEY